MDLARGIALWFIFIDHVPGNVLGDVTLRNVALCDATEAFVLLAGYAAGLAYGRQMDREGWLPAAAKVLGRVFTLYVAHIFLFVVFTAQVGYSAAALDSMAYLDEMHLDAFGEQPYRALLEALLLRFQPAFLNILPLYIVILGMFAAALPLLRHPGWLLAGSSLLYAYVRMRGVNLPSWTGGGWFFNPLAWQLLFVLGATMGYAPPGGPVRQLRWNRWLGLACGLVLLASFVTVVFVYHRREWLDALPIGIAAVVDATDKTALHPFRLLAIVAIAYLAAHAVPRSARWLQGPVAAPLVLMGQQGLPVFCAGIALAFLGRLAIEVSENWAMQAAVNLAGLTALVLMGAVAAWSDGKPRPPRPSPEPNAPPLPRVAVPDTA
ncbi:OpgC family protein [Roseomonas sp. CCTCC AB2023176]|uniref:OpgC family protein n=1 Tax=Roseomonas sp. CCTCC AB2023176 TaxID=3342640 RepID=UPI0035E09321